MHTLFGFAGMWGKNSSYLKWGPSPRWATAKAWNCSVETKSFKNVDLEVNKNRAFLFVCIVLNYRKTCRSLDFWTTHANSTIRWTIRQRVYNCAICHLWDCDRISNRFLFTYFFLNIDVPSKMNRVIFVCSSQPLHIIRVADIIAIWQYSILYYDVKLQRYLLHV